MLLPTPPIFKKRSTLPSRARAVGVPIVPLELILGNYDPGQRVELLFNQAIDTATMELSAFTVNDGSFTNETYRVIGVYQDAPEQVVLQLEPISLGGETGVQLTAGPTNGIRAVNGGEAWPGVNELPLPYQ